MPPQEISDFRPSQIVSEALFEVRTAPWRNHHAPCSLAEPRFPEKAWLREASPVRVFCYNSVNFWGAACPVAVR